MSDDERNKALENACGEDGGRRYSIRQVADMFDMEPSTLRYYEDAGLLTNVERTSTGQRVYRQGHINRLSSICCFKHAGMSIADLKRFFVYEADERTHIDDMMTLLEERHDAIDEQLRALEEAHAHVLRILTTRWLGVDPHMAKLLRLDTAHYSVLSVYKGDRVIERWNC